MARRVTNPMSVIEIHIKALQKWNQYKADKAQGNFTQPYSDEVVEKSIETNRKELYRKIEQYTQAVDYSLPEDSRPRVIRGY